MSGGVAEVMAQDRPVITSMTSNRAPAGEGEPTYVILYGTGFEGVTAVTFGGVPATLFAVGTDGSLLTGVPPQAAGVVDIEVVTPNGTSEPGPASRFNYVGPPVITSVVVEPGSSGVRIHGYNLFDIMGVGFDNGEAFLFERNDQPDSPGASLFAAWSAVNAPRGTVNVSVFARGGTASGSGRFPVAPTASALSPVSGSTAGGTIVTVTGDDFVAGATSVAIGGTTVPAASVTVSSATSLSFTTPAHAAGNAAVTVTTSNGTSGVVPGGFTYVAANPPVVTSMTTNRAPAGEGDPTYVVLFGTGFEGVTAVTFGGVPATLFGLGTDGSLLAGVPPQAAGVVDIEVVTPQGTNVPGPVTRFTYIGPPTITSVVVNPRLERVELQGTNLLGIRKIDINGADAPQFTRNEESDATGTTAVAYWDRGAQPTTTAAVRVFALGGRADATGYLYGSPTLSAISPATGPVTGGTSVTLTGTDFVQGFTSVSIGGATLPATEVTVASATSLSFTTPAHAAGNVDVTVTNPTATSGAVAGGFTYASADAPVVTSISPNRGFYSESSSLYVVIYGSNLRDATGVTFGGVRSDFVAWTDVEQALVVMVPAGTGTVDVQVITPNGASAPNGASRFTYYGPPVITSVDVHPESGGVEIHGYNLFGISSVEFDNGEAAFIVDRNMDENSTGTVVRASWQLVNAPSGTINVTVYAAGGAATGTGYALSMPTLTAISPAGGSTAGGTAVTLTGTNFVAGATSVMIGSTVIPVESVTVNSATSLTFTTPENAAGTVGVTVTTPNGTSGVAPGGFTYSAVIATPTLASIAPPSGPVAGGTSVTLTGTNFVAGSTSVSIGGAVIPASGVVVNSATSLTFVTPAHAAGTVDVTATTPEGTTSPAPGGFTYQAPAPVAHPVSATVAYGSADTPIPLDLAGGPADSVEVVVQAGNGVAVATGTSIRYTPNAGYVGADSFTYRAINAAGASEAALVSLTVSPPAAPTGIPLTTPPVAYNTGSAAPTTFTVSATGDPTQYAVSASASGAVVGISNAGEVTYTPPVGFRGADTFTFTATNAGGVSGPATVTVPIGNPTLSASLVGSGVRGAALSGVQITPAGGAAPYGCGASVASGALPAGVAINADCTITGTPAASGTFNFTVNITDSSTGAGPFTQSSGTLTLVVAAPTLNLSPASGALPGATAGAAYSQTFTAGGGTAPYAYSLTTGALPTGLTLIGGTLSGTPNAVGTFNFTLTASDSSSAGSGGPYSVSTAYSLVVAAPVILLTGTVPDGAVGSAYAATVTASGAVGLPNYALTAGALPTGLTLTSFGAITGTPTAGGTFNFTITATDGSTGPGAPYSGSQAYVLNIAAPTLAVSPASLSDATVGAAYSRTITASGGTAGYSYAVTAGALPAGLTLSASGVLSGTPTAGGSFSFTITATDSSSGSGPFAASRAYTLTVNAPTVTITPNTLTPATVGVAYSGAITASGGTGGYTFAVTAGALPAGLTLAADGTLSGTATAGGLFNFTITATDSSTGTGAPFSGSRAYAMSVNAPTIVLNQATLPDTRAGVAYSQTLTASGGTGPYAFAVTAGALPPGWTLAPTGALTGRSTESNTFTFTITATDSSTGTGAPFTGSRAYTVNVGLPNFTLTAPTLSATAGQPYSGAFVAGGGTAPFVYSRFSGTIPPGLTLGTDGVLSGTPTASGRFNFAVVARDATTGPGSPFGVGSGYTFTVAAPVLALGPTALPDGALNTGYNGAVVATGGVAPYAYAVTAGALPPGLILNPGTGVIAGASGTAGAFNFTVTATDSSTGAGGPFSISRAYSVAIAKGSQTIIFTSTAPSAVVAGPAYDVTAISSSNLGVTLTLDASSTGCVLSGSTVTFTTPGTCVINADQAGDSNWNPAAQVQQSFTVIANPPIAADVANVAVPYASAGTAIDLSGALTGGARTSITIATAPAHGTANVSGDVVTYTPAATYYGADSFTYTATGPGGTSNVATVSLTVATPAAPVAADKPGVAIPWNSSGTAIDLSASITGVRGSIAIGAAPSHGTVTVAGEVVTYTPATGYHGADSFTYTASGPGGTSNVATVSLTVATPAAPVASDKSGVAVPWNSPGMAIDLSTSITGVHSSLAIGTAPAHGAVSMAGDVVTYTPATGYYGADSFTFTATGPGGTSNVATVSLTVATPAAPVAADKPGIAVPWNSSGTAIDLSASITGVRGAIAIGAAPSHGTVMVAGEVVTYTPTTGYYGADSFTFTATGPGGTSNIAMVSVTVANPPAPTVSAVSGVAVPYASTGVAINLAGSVSGVHGSIAIASAPAHGTATVSGDVVTYTPPAAYYGPDSFTYTATGPGGTSAPATVSLTVATPPPPVIDTPTDPVVAPPSTGGPSQPVVVNLGAVSEGVIDGFRITVTARHGTAAITVQAAPQAQTSGGSGPQSAPGDYQLTYTPAANFMGTDTVTVVAYGPGGDSSPVTFTFQVAGKAPDLSGAAPSNGSVSFTPTSTLVGGPFQALRITRAPAFGTATVNGLTLVFTPGAANGGSTSLDYVIDLPFGSSAAGRIDLVSNLVPGAQALTAETVQGHPVAVRISNTAGGPFTGAAVVSVSPTTAGTATVTGSGGVYDLTFTPTGTFSGAATVTFSLTNASGTTNGTLAVTVAARPDPGLDPEVRGVATSQVTAARRFADAQINNFQRRLQDLHDGINGSSNGLSLNLGGSMDDDRDPRQALRRQLGQQDNRLDPGALGDDRDREMLGLDLWSGQPSANAAGPGGDRLNMAGGQPSTRTGGGSVGFWTSGSVDWGRQDADGVRDSRFTTQGVTAGLDVRVSDQLIIGGGLGYGEDKTKIGDNGSVSNGQAFTGALYASWRPADAFYIDGVIGWSDMEFDSRRWTAGIGTDPAAYAEGDRSGDTRFLSAAFGRILRGENVTSEFYARVDARSISLGGFTEIGAGISSLAWGAVDQDSVSGNLGAAIRWRHKHTRYGLFRPSARIELSHEFEDIGDQGVRYADWVASPTYLVPLDAWSRDSLRLDLGADWSVNDRLEFGVGYRGAFGDADSTHGGEVRMKVGW